MNYFTTEAQRFFCFLKDPAKKTPCLRGKNQTSGIVLLYYQGSVTLYSDETHLSAVNQSDSKSGFFLKS